MNWPTVRDPVSLSTRVATNFIPRELESLKQWHVIRHLGTGSTARVWLLQHNSDKRYAACKVAKDHQGAVILSQEAELADSLSHENLVASVPTDVPQPDNLAISFWEYLPAGSLANLITATGKLTVAETVTVLLPMIQVAEYLHARQVVHGDISPQNILFDLTGRPVLIDLGASRATAHSYTRTGTPGFTAPEIMKAPSDCEGLGSAADVYSLAAVGWFCLTGTVPGPPRSRVPLVDLCAAVDDEIIQLLEACLSAEPALRPSLEHLLKMVSYWAEPEPVDLHATVDEEYELLLPTREPAVKQVRSPRRRWRRRLGLSQPDAKAPRNRNPRVSRRRVLLGLSGVLLACGVAATLIYGVDEQSQHAGHEGLEVSKSEVTDFQSVIDTLAKERTAAWSTTNAGLVGGYAASDSGIFAEDTAVLESLHRAEHTLDGIRMRATVESTELTENGVEVGVQWRVDNYIQRDASGEALEEFDTTTDHLRLTLEDTPDGWRIIDAVSA